MNYQDRSLRLLERGIILGAGSYAAAFLLVRSAVLPSASSSYLLSNVAFLPVGLLTLIAGFYALAQLSGSKTQRRAWGLILGAALSRTVGDGAWFYVQNVQGTDPSTTWANIPYLLMYPLLLAGLFSFPMAKGRRIERIRFGLDAATVVVTGGMFLWYFGVRPRIHAGEENMAGLLLALAYPVCDLLVLRGVSTILFRRSGATTGFTSIRLLSVSLLANLVGNVLWSVPSLLTAQSLIGSDSLYMVSEVLLIMAMVRAAREVNLEEPAEEGGAPGLSGLPYLAVALGYGLLVIVTLTQEPGPVTDLVVAAVLPTAAVMIRQLISVKENTALAAEQAARETEARFRSLVHNSSDLILVLESDSTIRFASPSVERIFGAGPGELAGSRLLDRIHPNDLSMFREALLFAGAHRGDEHPAIESRWRRQNGECAWVETVVTDLRDDPSIHGLVLNSRDVSERRSLQERLYHQAFHDGLTGLANRALFEDRVDHALDRAARAGTWLAVLFIDLDQFKTINDSLGHAQGDRLLLIAAERLRHCIRAADTGARLGGDEFAVLIEDLRDPTHAALLAEQITRAFEAPVVLEGRDVTMAASIGIAVSKTAGSRNELLRSADMAMYAAKAHGGGRHVFFEPRMHESAVRRLEFKAEFHRAIAEGGLELSYQPIVDLGRGHLIGVEALVRWCHPTRGRLLPAEFIGFAEETGLIVPMGRWVLREAMLEASRWIAPPDRDPPFITINVAPRQLTDLSLVTDVAQALDISGLAPSRVVLEVTESALTQNPEVRRALEGLRALGVSLAVDDFGTGYSSLMRLHEFPLDTLKIPRPFIEKLTLGGARDSAVGHAIVLLGQTLGLRTVAEGVESPEQAERLRSLGCNAAQGYWFARPMQAEAIRQLTSTQAPGLLKVG